MTRTITSFILVSILLLQGCYTLVNAPASEDEMVIKNVPSTQEFFLGNSMIGGLWDPWWEPSYSPYGFDSYYSYLNPYGTIYNSYATGYPYYGTGYTGNYGYYIPVWGIGRVSPVDTIGISRSIGRDVSMDGDRLTNRTPVNDMIMKQQISAAANPSATTGSLERVEPRVSLARKYRNQINFNAKSTSTPATPAPPTAPPNTLTKESASTATPSATASSATSTRDRETENTPRQRKRSDTDNTSRR
ncbi:MAG: hypothetical protein K9N34_09335 [Candidatus Marinimicrobia bacterium]|nr:hypothetical protein [Candidatus Neomarinimicrobiota bacterium]MCF7840803.1 hypothetical protein [Candidatus Neomarinimicrobiota bacterium]MCF7901884.1 hypothetical protein [Candidatus Neomarinimicrobiota bacterium]